MKLLSFTSVAILLASYSCSSDAVPQSIVQGAKFSVRMFGESAPLTDLAAEEAANPSPPVEEGGEAPGDFDHESPPKTVPEPVYDPDVPIDPSYQDEEQSDPGSLRRSRGGGRRLGMMPPQDIEDAHDYVTSANSSNIDDQVIQRRLQPPALNIDFEGIAQSDFQFINGVPPDPVGDVGPNHYVQMVNSAVAVFDKQGNVLVPAISLASVWAGTSCGTNDGDPIVLHDQFEDRWILMKFATACSSQNVKCFTCFAVSTTPDPTGTYYRYLVPAPADPNGVQPRTFFPDYPKIGVWSDSYLLTTRDFGLTASGGYGIAVYALEKASMISGLTTDAVRFFLDEANLDKFVIGDGLLPADIDGDLLPPAGTGAPIIGSMDNEFNSSPYDALNVFELFADWASSEFSLSLFGSIATDEYDSRFDQCGCIGNGCNRDCLPQPGVNNKNQFLDVQSYRQRVIHRLAYRNFGDYESMVTCHSVEARDNVAGKRWYEIKRTGGAYQISQQGTFAPDDVNRWMGSIAQDQDGNMAMGYSVVSASVFPGIRYTGRLAGDPLGEMPLGEATLIDGGGVQLTTFSRWGDYSSMNIDPSDDCTFWYVNQYYETSSVVNWQTRIGSFTMPGCGKPANDLCIDAIDLGTLTSFPLVTSGTTAKATIDDVFPSPCTDGYPPEAFDDTITAPGVWYTFESDLHCISASTCGGTAYDSKISVYAGDDCGDLKCVDGNNDAGGSCGLQSFTGPFPVKMMRYYVLVHGSRDAEGDFTLVLSESTGCKKKSFHPKQKGKGKSSKSSKGTGKSSKSSTTGYWW